MPAPRTGPTVKRYLHHLTILLFLGSVAASPAAEGVRGAPDLALATRTYTCAFSRAPDGLRFTLQSMDATGPHIDGWILPRHAGPAAAGGARHHTPIALQTGDGALAPDLVFLEHALVHESPGIDHATLAFRDADRRIRVEVHIRAYRNEDVLEQWTTIRNDAGKALAVASLDSLILTFDTDQETHLEWYDSGVANEVRAPTRERLSQELRQISGKEGNRHVKSPMPYFSLGLGTPPAETQGTCMLASLAWSGSARMSFARPDARRLGIAFGVNQPMPVPLDAGATLTSPACVFTFSAAGKSPASRNLHQWMRRYAMRDGDRIRPIDNNSWEACQMDISAKAIIDMMRRSVDLGIELYVMDDGWFGNGACARTSDRAGLGDWQINHERFPDGLAPILAASRELGIAFGIWFEPEMVNPTSGLFKQHPEWVMRVPGSEFRFKRNQLVLDVANPAVQEFMFRSVDDLLVANPGIRFVKWDCNSWLTNPYSPFLGPDRQGEMLNRYLEGYYNTLKRLVAAHPSIDFQACSAGGGRADLGAMRYSHTFWPSDNTDPSYRLGAVWNYTTYMPAMAATCHVTHAPRKAAAPRFPTKYRFDVAMMGQLGMEVDPRTSTPEYLAASRVGIAAYKEVRDIVQLGEQYRHSHPFDSVTPSMNYVTIDRRRALVLAYQTGDLQQDQPFTAPVAGLDPQAMYRVSETNLPPDDDRPRLQPGTVLLRRGDDLMTRGLPLIFSRRSDSGAIVLTVP